MDYMEEAVVRASRDLIRRGCMGSLTCGFYEEADGKQRFVIHAERANYSSDDFFKDWRKLYERCISAWHEIQAERKEQSNGNQ
jgi:hypothetical protein